MKLAHVSDLHVLDLDGVPARAYANKRLLGYANLRAKRSHQHHAGTAAAVLREVARLGVDHVVITGDLTNLALETELRAARHLIESSLGLAPESVSVIPGNHDAYVAGALASYEKIFNTFMTSDLPELARRSEGGAFPFVRLRGPLAIVGLSSALPRPPFVAAGRLGAEQRAALKEILAHERVREKTPVVLVHHPSYAPRSRIKAVLEGLHDGESLERALACSHPALVLHGHLHRRIVRRTRGQGGLTVVGATSASLHHHDPDRMAGLNLYTFDASGALTELEARVFDADAGGFVRRAVPEAIW